MTLLFFSISILLLSSLFSACSSSHTLPIPHSRSASSLLSRVQRRQQENQPAMSFPTLHHLNGGAQADSTVITKPAAAPSSSQSLTFSTSRVLLASWSFMQVLLILGNALRRLIPIVAELDPRTSVAKGLIPLTREQWGMLVVWVLYMMYAEGYKGFYQKLSPLIVKRALLLNDHASVVNVLFGGLFASGMIHANQKRLIVSWGVSLGVLLLVVGVKRLPYPFRGIVDAGVVAGLTFGALSTAWLFARAIVGRKLPDVDACLPASSSPPSHDHVN
jgi:hypothetical protein